MDKVDTVIGFDYGTSWIGIAVGQTLTAQARPLNAIKAIRQKPDWTAIQHILEAWQPQRLIVGLPTSMINAEQPMNAKATRFSRQLEGRFHIPVELVDERLTTREAYLIAIESNERKSKPEIDSISAVLITESWLRSYTCPTTTV